MSWCPVHKGTAGQCPGTCHDALMFCTLCGHMATWHHDGHDVAPEWAALEAADREIAAKKEAYQGRLEEAACLATSGTTDTVPIGALVCRGGCGAWVTGLLLANVSAGWTCGACERKKADAVRVAKGGAK